MRKIEKLQPVLCIVDSHDTRSGAACLVGLATGTVAGASAHHTRRDIACQPSRALRAVGRVFAEALSAPLAHLGDGLADRHAETRVNWVDVRVRGRGTGAHHLIRRHLPVANVHISARNHDAVGGHAPAAPDGGVALNRLEVTILVALRQEGTGHRADGGELGGAAAAGHHAGGGGATDGNGGIA